MEEPGGPTPVSYRDRVLIVGKTQSGKSTLARFLSEQMGGTQRFAVDVKGRLSLGVPPVRDVAAIDWSAPVVHFIPSAMDRAIWEPLFDEVFTRPGPRSVWLDEARGITTANYAPPSLRLICQQGAELGVGLIACAQRPVHITYELRSEPEHVFLFTPPPPRDDLETLAGDMGRDRLELDRRLRELLREHGRHAFLWYDRGADELHDCVPLQIAGEPAQPAPDETSGQPRPGPG